VGKQRQRRYLCPDCFSILVQRVRLGTEEVDEFFCEPCEAVWVYDPDLDTWVREGLTDES